MEAGPTRGARRTAPAARPGATLREPRRRQARRRPGTVRRRRRRPACPRRRRVDRAASPTPCCSAARRRWWPSTSVTASSTNASGTTPASTTASGPTCARSTEDDIDGPVDVVVADLSFISLRTVLPALLACARPGGDLVLLVKPQFEAGRAEAAKGRGRDPGPARCTSGSGSRALRCTGGRRSEHHGLDGVPPPWPGREPRAARPRPGASRGRRPVSLVVLVAHHERAEAAVLTQVVTAVARRARPPELPARRRRRGRRPPGFGRARPRSRRPPTSPSASAATAPCCAPSSWSAPRACRSSASTSACSGTSPRWSRRRSPPRSSGSSPATTRSRSG